MCVCVIVLLKPIVSTAFTLYVILCCLFHFFTNHSATTPDTSSLCKLLHRQLWPCFFCFQVQSFLWFFFVGGVLGSETQRVWNMMKHRYNILKHTENVSNMMKFVKDHVSLYFLDVVSVAVQYRIATPQKWAWFQVGSEPRFLHTPVN